MPYLALQNPEIQSDRSAARANHTYCTSSLRKVAVYVAETIVMFCVDAAETTVTVCVAAFDTTVALWVPPATKIEAVVGVIVMLQFAVLREAATAVRIVCEPPAPAYVIRLVDAAFTIVRTLVDAALTTDCNCVAPAKMAVAVASRTSTRYQAVPSLAIAQSRAPEPGLVTGKKRLIALAVFGVSVTFLNVTVFDVPIDHAPVNVATRNTRGFDSSEGRRDANAAPSGRVCSTIRTTRAIRSADGRVKRTRSMRHPKRARPSPSEIPLLPPPPPAAEIVIVEPAVATVTFDPAASVSEPDRPFTRVSTYAVMSAVECVWAIGVNAVGTPLRAV